MTDWQAAPPTPSVPDEPGGDSVPLWVFGLLVVMLLVGGAVAANELLKLRSDDDKQSYPDKWDARVLPYVKIVEKERGLRFFHPIEVEFLSDEAFKKDVTADKEDLTDEDRKEIEQATGLLRSLGLIEGELDLFEQFNTLQGSSVIGYYSYDDERIRIRGMSLGPAAKSTLVHELTHALQDQHFDLGKRQKAFEEDDDDAASTAFDALVEGDAERIQTAYRQNLSEKQRAALDRDQNKSFRDSSKQTTEVPEIFKTFMSSPYTLGEAMLALAVKLDGNDAVDRLFRDPPATDEHLLDPWTLIADHQDAIKVDEPKLEEGDDEFDSGDFGALGWYVVLAERVPLLDALDAVDGWGGDAYVAFERDGVSCVRVNYRGDTERDVTEMRSALTTWVDALPGGPASVRLDGDQLMFESCDPGKETGVGKHDSQSAIDLAVTRTYTAFIVLRAGAPEAASRCFANRAVHDLTWQKLLDPTYGVGDTAVQAKVARLIGQCR